MNNYTCVTPDDVSLKFSGVKTRIIAMSSSRMSAAEGWVFPKSARNFLKDMYDTANWKVYAIVEPSSHDGDNTPDIMKNQPAQLTNCVSDFNLMARLDISFEYIDRYFVMCNDTLERLFAMDIDGELISIIQEEAV